MSKKSEMCFFTIIEKKHNAFFLVNERTKYLQKNVLPCSIIIEFIILKIMDHLGISAILSFFIVGSPNLCHNLLLNFFAYLHSKRVFYHTTKSMFLATKAMFLAENLPTVVVG